MDSMTRREFVSGALVGTGLVVLAPIVPGCAKPHGGALPQGSVNALAESSAFFNVSDETAKKTIARALQHGGDFAELYLEHTAYDSLRLEEGKINEASASVTLGAGVRVVVGDQSGYAYTEDLSDASLLQAAQTASMIARGKAQGTLPDCKAVQVESRYPIQYAPTEFPVADKMDFLRRMDAAARKKSSLLQVALIWHSNEYRRVMIYRSDGQVLADARPRTSLGCFVTLKKGERQERNYYAEGGRLDQGFFAGNKPEAIAEEAVRRAEISLEAITPPAGEMPVVLGPGHSGILLHEAIGHGLEADFNRKKVSIYADRIGEKVASEFCTIVDDGTLPNRDGSISFDDEGSPSKRTVLIENGVLKGYMQDRISAKFFKTEPTGNGKRQSYKHPPLPRMTNTLMLNGPHSKEEVFEGIEKGIYAIDFTNGQVNIGAGDYTFFVNYGYLIENGKITAPIKDVNIVGNGPESLSRVDRVGNDMMVPDSASGYCGKGGQRVTVNYGVPHLRISRVNVGGRSVKGGA